MIAELGCNCTCWYKPSSSQPTSNLLRHPALKTGTQTCATGRRERKKKCSSTHSALLSNIMVGVIAFPPLATVYCRGEGSRQLEIHVSEASIRHQLILLISSPVSRPLLFLAAQIIDQPPLCVRGTELCRRSRGGENFIGPETKQPHQCCPCYPHLSCLSLLSLQALTVSLCTLSNDLWI